jgi:hypothetical protein
MHRQRIPGYVTIAIVALGAAWVGMWISTASFHGSKGDVAAGHRQAGADFALAAVRQLTDAELANVTGLIAVAEVDASELFLETPIGGGPPGVGVRFTNYSLHLLQVLKAEPSDPARTVTLRLQGEPGDLVEENPPDGTAAFFPEVGKRYLVVAGFYEGHYFVLASGGGFTEITSPEQETQLVDYWNGLLGATPEATSIPTSTSTSAESTSTAVGTLAPTELATESATDTVVPTDVPTSAPTSASTETPTVDAGSSTPTPTSGP